MRIAGITIPDDKRIEISLTYLYGVGRTTSNLILKEAGIDPNKRAKDITSDESGKLQALLDKNFKIEGNLRREITSNVKRLKEIGSWRGTRLIRNLPIHGRSKTNSRTARSPGAGSNTRRTMGSGRKPSGAKT